MSAATQSAESVEIPRERFPRASLTGFFLGFSPAAASCVAAGGIIAGFAAPMIGGLSGVAASSPLWIGLLLLGLIPSKQVDGRIIDWTPVLASWAIRRVSHQNQFRRSVWRTRPAGTLWLPGSKARLRMYCDPVSGAVMIHDPHKRTLVAACKVSHSQFMLADAKTKSVRTDGFAGLLATVGSGEGVCRVQVLLSSAADAGVGVRQYWADNHDRDVVDTAAGRNYRTLLRQAASVTQQHETAIAVALDLNQVREDVKQYGGGLKGGAAVLRQRMRDVEALAGPSGLTLRGWVTDKELSMKIRAAYDPVIASRLRAHPDEVDDLESAGPMAVEGQWKRVRTDSAWHQVLVIGSWPRVRVETGFLSGLNLVSEANLSISLIYKPVPDEKASREAERANQREVGALDDRNKVGKLDTVLNKRDRIQTEQNMLDLDDGHKAMDHACLVTVTAPTREALDRAVADVRAALRKVKCKPRTLVGVQDEVLEAGVLPLCLGVR